MPETIDNHTGLPVLLQPDNRQLGTADWYRGGGSAVGPFEIGNFYLGRSEDGRHVGVTDNRHALIVCNTRGGKGVSVIVPNLCLWPGSVVVIDPKGENAMVTARRRGGGSIFCDGLGQTVRLLDPFDVMGMDDSEKASFNPLDALHPDKEESVDEAARIADSIIVSERSSDPFFDESARAYWKFVLLHLRTSPDFSPEERNLITARTLIMAGDEKAARLAAFATDKPPPSAFSLLFAAMKRNPAFNGVVARGGAMLAHMEESSPRLFGSVVQVATTHSDFLDSPAMARVVSKSTFQLAELKTNPRGTSLYISLPQRYMETHSRWLRMMTTLVVTEMERVKGQPACGHPVMMVLDEFPALKRMRVLENAAAQIAGFGVKLVFVAQTLGQLQENYDKNWETLIANAGVKLFFCNDDYFTREYVSKSIGEREIVRTLASASKSTGNSYSFTMGVSQSYSSSASQSGGSASSSTAYSSSFTTGHSQTETSGLSQSLHKRFLVTPDEVGRLFGNPEDMKAIALISGHQPMALRRTPYFKEEYFEGTFDRHCDHPAPPDSDTLWLRRGIRSLVREYVGECDYQRAQEKRKKEEAEAHARKEHEKARTILAEAARIKAERRAEYWACFKMTVGTVLIITAMWGWTWMHR
ncbi:type IV secretory system conjugative DNA transfer family protein [Bradyrhizobium betae]|uniref:type IV secretory system conjugative DNA transfer family protein n=1 Tax=Bradyrhizobium betae TaxID=244734 RepID=UPI003D67DD2B